MEASEVLFELCEEGYVSGWLQGWIGTGGQFWCKVECPEGTIYAHSRCLGVLQEFLGQGPLVWFLLMTYFQGEFLRLF